MDKTKVRRECRLGPSRHQQDSNPPMMMSSILSFLFCHLLIFHSYYQVIVDNHFSSFSYYCQASEVRSLYTHAKQIRALHGHDAARSLFEDLLRKQGKDHHRHYYDISAATHIASNSQSLFVHQRIGTTGTLEEKLQFTSKLKEMDYTTKGIAYNIFGGSSNNDNNLTYLALLPRNPQSVKALSI